VAWSQSAFPDIVDELKHSTQLDAELVRSGMLIVNPPDIERAQAWAKETGNELQLLDGEQALQLEPTLANTPQQPIEQALWMPQVGQVRNPRLVKALRDHLIKNGVLIQENTEVTALHHEQGRIYAVQTEQTEFKPGSVAIACGAWSSKLWPVFGPALEVKPIRGQMLLLKTRPGLVNRIVLAEEHYIIPRQDGRVLIGSTMEDVGFDKTTTDDARNTLLDFAHRLMPVLRDFPVEHQWAGLRPGTPDNIPKIMEHPEIKGLFINAGHFRNGVVTAPAAAQLLVNLMLDQTPILDPAPYS
jgi:glycine oxidase